MNNSIFGKFYSPVRALSYGRPIIISIGSRSIGKTTGWLIWAVDRALNGHRFVYVRRRQSDLDATAEDALANVEIIFHQNKYISDSMHFVYDHGKYYATEGKTKIELGMTQALSLSTRKKSSAAGSLGYDCIIYDECICENPQDYITLNGDINYEYKLLMNLYITLARKVGQSFNKNFYLICIGNAASYFCPIILGLDADKWLTQETKYLAPKDLPWIVEQTAQVEATKSGNDVLRKLLSKNDYDYVSNGKNLDDNEFIVKDIKCKHPVLSCQYKQVYFTIFREGDFTVCSPIRSQLPVIALSYDDGRINREYDFSRSKTQDILRQASSIGKLVFTNQKVKRAVLTYLKYI